MSIPSVAETALAPPAGDAWGEVRARDHVVRYRRAGVGPTVLLLQSPDGPNPIWPEVLEVVASGARLIVPEPPSENTNVESWLSALLDGLGLSNVTVVASDDFCIAALERALLEPDRIARVLLVCRGRGTEGAIGGTIDSSPSFAKVPLLMVRRDHPAEEVLPLVERFLEREGLKTIA